MTTSLLTVSALARSFSTGEGATRLEVLRGISLMVNAGEFVAITGPSGSGKSTLLYLLGALDRPSAGEIILSGRSLNGLSDEGLSQMRAREIGFVFQSHCLLPELSALENVLLPQWILHVPSKLARLRALELLAHMNLSHRLHHRPAQLSGGEQQRVAIARALANRPALLLGDELTGNLDTATGQEVFSLLRRFNQEEGQTTLLVTHNPALAEQADRVLGLVDGHLACDRRIVAPVDSQECQPT